MAPLLAKKTKEGDDGRVKRGWKEVKAVELNRQTDEQCSQRTAAYVGRV